MGSSPDDRDARYQQRARTSKGPGEVSRRTMLTGAVATTAVVAALPFSGSNVAQAADANAHADMVAFLLLSAALTGVRVVTLAPEFPEFKPGTDPKIILSSDPGVDPFNVKDDYFAKIQARDATTFKGLLGIAKSHPLSASDIVAAVQQASDDTKLLARSIVLLWYLGSWYDPDDLRRGASPPGTRTFVASGVLSAKAYTQGLVWKIAQAHPMGYSNLQFGYWSRLPKDPNDTSDLITAKMT